MKKLSMLLSFVLVLSILAGCAGTPVIYYSDCTCPTGTVHEQAPNTTPTEAPVLAEGALKTGLFIVANNKDSVGATAETNGEAKYDVTVVAVTVDADGVIRDCIIDSVGTSVKFDATGAITSDVTAPVLTKNELGPDYGMVAWGGAVAEWDQQAAALAKFAVGKNVLQLRNGAVNESGYAPEGSDLATSATIYLGGYVRAIELAASLAKDLGAQAGDQLKLAVIPSLSASKAPEGEGNGTAQLDMDVVALTVSGETITSCYIDSLQAKMEFDAQGNLLTKEGVEFATKNDLGEQYGMVAWGGAKAEWNQQAASFAAYVTGKTPAEVAGIALTETTAPADADLAASVTISVAGFQKLIQKACQE